ncbi:MAG TPA: hypothetical protein GXZ27_03115 [Thermoanaerobacterales bacterium]|nr:hypothetical protein [Thermoanaerobacterales bacterium]
MYFFRYDRNVLDFTKGPATEKILKMADNCFVRERKERITLYRLKLSMACSGSFRNETSLDYYMIMNKRKSNLTCGRCSFALLGEKRLCCVNSFLLPRHFHHKNANFRSLVVMLQANGYQQLPVPDPLTWSYMTFRY